MCCKTANNKIRMPHTRSRTAMLTVSHIHAARGAYEHSVLFLCRGGCMADEIQGALGAAISVTLYELKSEFVTRLCTDSRPVSGYTHGYVRQWGAR